MKAVIELNLHGRGVLVVAVLCLCLSACGLRAAPPVDAHGARKLSPLPRPGVHPRALFTGDDWPDIKRRLSDPGLYGKVVVARLRREVTTCRRAYKELAALGPKTKIDAELLARHWRSNEGRNIQWGVTSMFAAAESDAELKQFMIRTITNYARLILASKDLRKLKVEGPTGVELNKRFNVWKSNRFDLGVCWIFGGAGMAVSYDVLYNDMTPDQRGIVRGALAAAIKGRMSYGMNEPRGKAISNHYGYHGDLALMCAAIEGEQGCDRATYRRIEQVLTDYFTVGFTPTGACHEDTYGPNLGMREGSRGLMVLARRGRNLFATRQYRNFVSWMAQSLEPFPRGGMVGGASGATGRLYPGSVVLAKYMYPSDPVADHVYRWHVGDDYKPGLRWQGFLDYAVFGMPFAGDPARPSTLEGAGLGLSAFYPRRGKLIARSDWSPAALYFHLDARPDAFMIGHDTVDRGTFMLSALGRSWVIHPPWNLFRKSGDYSLVHIDGKAQAWKAPSVKFLHQADTGRAVVGVADLKYAYDWQWSPPWPSKDKKFPAPWKPEMSDPREIGWPDDPDWLPNKLHGTDKIGYVGSYMWRRPYNTVRKAFRSAILVRRAAPRPGSYVLIADDVVKDAAAHEYVWHMQLATDVEIDTQNGNDIVLRDPKDDRRLLVRVLHPAQVDSTLASYTANKDRNGKPIMGKRLLVSCRAVAPRFRVLLFPHRKGTELPTTVWKEARRRLDVALGGQNDEIRFLAAKDGSVRPTLKPDATP